MATATHFFTPSSPKTTYSPRNTPYSPRQYKPKIVMNPYDDFKVVKRLNEARFPVYLAKSNSTKKHFVIKVFPHAKPGVPSPHFTNELRFSSLNHHNIIQVYHHQNKRDFIIHEQTVKASYVCMEYAPYGDFFDLIKNYNLTFDDKLARTYFHQLINSVEYLHYYGIAHLDIKPENVLLGEDYQMKIADFDLSYKQGDTIIQGKGTKYFRAPEIVKQCVREPKKADIFSSAILLFILKTNGVLPQVEDVLYEGVVLYDLLQKNPKKYWTKMTEVVKQGPEFFDEDFKELFMWMMSANPDDRPTLSEIKRSKWYNGPIYDNAKLKEEMKKQLYMKNAEANGSSSSNANKKK